MKIPIRARSLGALAAGVALFVPVAIVLLTRVVNTVATPLAPDDRGDWTPVPIDLQSVRKDRQFTLPVHVGAPSTLLHHSRVGILFATHGTAPALDEAILEWPDGTCAYRSVPGAALVNNDNLEFVRDATCRADHSRAADLTLTVRLRERGARVAVWAYAPPAGEQPPEFLRIWQGAPGPTPAGIIRGTYLEADGPRPRRLALFNYVWGIAADPTWIWVALGIAGALVFAGVRAMPVGPLAPDDRRRFTARAALANASLALALGILYAVFVPPLQAPDEPAHLQAFANATGRTGMLQSIEALARRGHVERLRFHGDERFRARDIGHPYMQPLSEMFVSDVQGRSLTTYWWWKAAGTATRDLTTPRTVLATRLGNALLFAATFAIAAAFVVWAAPGGTPQLLPIAPLLIPTLPFFAMHVSEFALLTDAYVLMAAAVCVLAADGPRSHAAGAMLGAGMALALLSGRSAAPMLALFAAALAARALLGTRDTAAAALRPALVFWAGCGAGLALFPLLATPEFSRGIWPQDAGTMPSWFKQAAEFLRTHPAIVLLCVPAGVLVELGFAWLRRRRAVEMRAMARAVGFLMATAVVASLLGSLFFEYPHLAPRELSMPTGMRDYVGTVLSVSVTALRVDQPDLLLWSSFWSGFGWIDTILPASMLRGLVLVVALPIVISGVVLMRGADTRHALWQTAVYGGGAAALAASAISSFYLNRNLHGRYVVGLYLILLVVMWTLPLTRSRADRSGVVRAAVILGVVIALHSYTIPFVLRRYF